MTREEKRQFLRICKSVDFLKVAPICKSCNIAPSNIYAFTNASKDDDVMISDKKLEQVTDMIYNCCLFIVDMYKDIENKKIG